MHHKARKLLANNLRALRKSRQMTQEDVAGAAEIDRSYVSLIENEKFAASVDMVEKIASVFALEPYEMLQPEAAKAAASAARS